MRRLLLSAILLAAVPAVSLAQEAETVQGAATQLMQETSPVQETQLAQNATPVQEAQTVQAATPAQQTPPAQGAQLVQETSFVQDALPTLRQRPPFVKQHELRLTAGAYPVFLIINWGGCCGGRDYFYDMYYHYDRTYRGAEYTSGAWSLSYDYRFKKWFDLGVVFSYYGVYSKSYDVETDAVVGRNRTHYLTVMPMVRFTWLNREWVRMYSSLGIGATFGLWPSDFNDRRFDSAAAFAIQLTPIGISVGRSFFGFAEIGVGAQGALMMGVGYKFKPKNNSVK